jgi:hypothetical protein
MTRRRWAGLVVLVGIALVPAMNAVATAPEGRYVTTAKTVTDRRTKLVWQRVVLAERLGVEAAKAACAARKLDSATWRLPTAAELQTLIDVRAHDPAVDGAAFPATPVERFWSATPYARAAGYSWAVDFATGTSNASPSEGLLAVRCVHAVAVPQP